MDGSSSPTHSPKKEIFRKDYCPPNFTIETVDLHFDIRSEDEVMVTARSSVRRADHVHEDVSLILDGSNHFELISVHINGVSLEAQAFEKVGAKLTVFSVPNVFELEVTTRLNPATNTRLEGLYASGGNLCTQCEAEGFRHITYALDRPDVLSVYSVRIEADQTQYPVLLSNGNPIGDGGLPGGRHYAEWHDPHPKPSYLFALVAGDLVALSDSFETKSGRRVALNVYVRHADINRCNHALESLKRAMIWDEEVYDLEYDLDVYNVVAVSDFNMGAMENKGLNIFNTKYVLADKESATDIDFANIEGVIGHEYFHNWTGNRVTCRDWFQLSLKEGLTVFRDQEFSADMSSRGVKRIDDVRTLRLAQFPEDAGPLAHPIRPDSFIEINNFYTATVYNKGAEVIRMIQCLLGRKVFIDGVKHYLSKHDGMAATCEDFIVAMEAVSGRSLLQFRRWYEQAGTPTVQIELRRSGTKVLLDISQVTAATPGQPRKAAFQIPISMQWFGPDGETLSIDGSGPIVSAECGYLIELTGNDQTIEFHDVPDGAVPSLHRAFSAPVRLDFNQPFAERVFLLRHETDAYARWQAAQEIYSESILSAYHADRNYKDGCHAELQAIFGDLLVSDEEDRALMAELLSFPSEQYLGQLIKPLDPLRLHHARHDFLKFMVNGNANRITDVYLGLSDLSARDGQVGVGARRLRNLLLGYIALADLDGAEVLTKAQYETANNMTDQFAALMAFSHSSWDSREDVIARFYEQWKTNELVIDKWFSAQALSLRPNSLDDVTALLKHTDFSYSNPNRLRSLVLTFASGNPSRFHAADGSGYQFLARCITEVDQINPQTAARMVPPLARWKDLMDPYHLKMKGALSSVLASTSVSDDVRELVEKSIA